MENFDKKIIDSYLELKSIEKVGLKFNLSYWKTRKILLEYNVLNSKKKLDNVSKEEIYEKYVIEGKSLNELKEFYGYKSRDAIKRILKNHNIPLREKNNVELTFEELNDLYIIKNLSSKQISSILNISQSTVQHKLKKLGIKKNRDLTIECCTREYEKSNNIRFGFDYPFQNKNFLDKVNNYSRDKYGFEKSIFENGEIKEKIKKSNLEKYGHCSYSKTKEFKKFISKYNFENQNKNLNELGFKVLGNEESFLGFLIENKGKYTVSGLISLFNGGKMRIYKLLEMTNSYNLLNKNLSSYEAIFLEEFNKFFKNTIDIIINDRKSLKGLEIDFYLPEYKVGIEINPNYTHSFKSKNEILKGSVGNNINYHILKSSLANLENIQIIHVWEKDFLNIDKLLRHIKSIIENNINIELIQNKYISKDLYSYHQITREYRIIGHYKGYFLSSGLFPNVVSTEVKIIDDNSIFEFENQDFYKYMISTSGLWEVQRL